MATTLVFRGGVSVDMTNATTLYEQNALADFASADNVFFYGPIRGNGVAQPLTLQNYPGEIAQLRLWSPADQPLVYSEGDVQGGFVNRIEFLSPADLATDYASPLTYRLALLFDDAPDFASVFGSLLELDPSPLYADDDLLVYGDVQGDTLVGGAHDDTLFGAGGADRLLGRAGADRLFGGSGHDVLRGGAGADRFVFTMAGSTNSDTVVDFNHSQNDEIVFDNAAAVFADLADGALTSGRFAAADNIGERSGGTGVGASDRVLYDTDSGRLYYDANGSGNGQRVLLGIVSEADGDHPTLVAGDFRVI